MLRSAGRTSALLAAALALIAAPAAAEQPGALTVTPVDSRTRAAYGLSPRYRHQVRVGALTILGSAKVPKAGLREAGRVVRAMTRARPELRSALAKRRIRIVVMAHDEMTTDVPEHAPLVPADFWNRRARGLGATWAMPIVSCGVENLLGYPGDPYAGQSILIHELSHTVHEFALARLDRTFDRRLRAAYAAAVKAKRWAGTYAGTNHKEYFAVGAQAYFGALSPGARNKVVTRAQLKTFDPPLFALLDEAFGKNAWRYPGPPSSPKPLPRFVWPARVLKAWRRHLAGDDLVRLTLRSGPPPWSRWGRPAGTRLRLVNQRKAAVQLVWVDQFGKRKAYHRVSPGGDHEQQTYAGHTWLVLDERQQPLGWVVATKKAARVDVR